MENSQSFNNFYTTSPTNDGNLKVRGSVTYHPSAWGDYFMAYASNSLEVCNHEKEVLERQKKDVKKLLAALPDDSCEKMHFIDAIQRLGLGYQFEKEISKSLENVYKNNLNNHKNLSLRSRALYFRLLRQQGYYVSCDVFKNLKDRDGKFMINDVQGLLSLYEAAVFRVHGENILDEAFEFCSTHLRSMVHTMTNKSFETQVEEALMFPIHKTLTLLGAKKFMYLYQQDQSHCVVLLQFAKSEFNNLQKKLQNELVEITRWWKALDFTNKLPFARDRVVECYFWSLAFYFEPRYHVARKILCKVAAMTSIIDDIYDVYGTLDELQNFTDAIQRWNVSALDQLPAYMKICYQALLDVYSEAEEELRKTGGDYCVHYAKEEMKKLVRTFLEEAKWLYKNEFPTMEKYMKIAVASSGYMMAITTALMGLDDLVSKNDFVWASSEPLAIRATSIIARLMNDMAGYGFEQDISAVECYMKENSVSKEETFVELQKQVLKAWKDINQACLETTPVSMPIMMRVLNAARMVHLLYKDKDCFTNSKTEMKSFIKSVLIEPVEIDMEPNKFG